MSAMFASLRHFLGWIVSSFCSRQELILENLALRQQLVALHAKRPRRRLSARQKLFWVVLRKLWRGWKKTLVSVTPRTVVGWHRAGFHPRPFIERISQSLALVSETACSLVG